MDKEDFYRRCAELLGTEYDCKPFPWTHSGFTRWNNRVPGSGRYPGFGIIRVYGSQVHVALNHPVSHSRIYQSQEEVLDFLGSLQKTS